MLAKTGKGEGMPQCRMEDLRLSEKVLRKAEVVDLSLSIKYDSEEQHSSDVRTRGWISLTEISTVSVRRSINPIGLSRVGGGR
jgi:hypothetical protein